MVGGEAVEATPYELLRDRIRALRLARLMRRLPVVWQDICPLRRATRFSVCCLEGRHFPTDGGREYGQLLKLTARKPCTAGEDTPERRYGH